MVSQSKVNRRSKCPNDGRALHRSESRGKFGLQSGKLGETGDGNRGQAGRTLPPSIRKPFPIQSMRSNTTQ